MDCLLTCEDHDNAIRWREGERLHHLFEERCDELRSHPAVVAEDVVLTYEELDRRANQLARHLLKRGVAPGDRLGLLFDRSFHTYVALLAVLKVHASYVPVDASFPKERIAFIAEDAGVRVFLTLSTLRHRLEGLAAPVVLLDSDALAIAGESDERVRISEIGALPDDLCYIVYTSGSTGNPKGVAVEHSSICNFVRVAADVYGLTRNDRMYQGMTIAFDFSVEELWVPLMAGATLVPGRSGLVGRELAQFLIKHEVTALCCVPTLLASIECELPRLRFLLVSGEACPHDLVVRWHKKGRTLLNAYGPTEATVTSTWTELHPDRPVTIGRPLPTYSVLILDPEENEPLPRGTLGEIAIAGIGLARGYVNRDDLTRRSFIPDFLGIPNNPSGRIYRTGDLGRITAGGEIAFHGRIDTQVKIRGYRIELTEIESIFLQLPEIAQAVVTTFEADAGTPELVAFYTLREGAPEVSSQAISESLRSRLPAYMIPAFVERIDAIPMLSSNKADRKKLPAPRGPRFVASSGDFVEPKTPTERSLASVLAEVLNLPRVSVTDHFFDELGADSLLMAQFCARLEAQDGARDVSTRDVYLHPTVQRLAAHIDVKPSATAPAVAAERVRIPSNFEYYGCGTLQFLSYLAFAASNLWAALEGFRWVTAAEGALSVCARMTCVFVAYFFASSGLAIVLKWLLIGRWKVEKFPIWSFRYYRFWVVKELIRVSPMNAFKGSPLFNVYLRLLGARIGKNAVIQSKVVPVGTDLLSIGAGSVLRADSMLPGYKAQANYIRTGRITIGRDAYVGVGTVVDIDTRIEDSAQIGHASTLPEHEVIPAGARYHGSPAEATSADYCSVPPRRCTPLRKVLYSTLELALLFSVPAALAVLSLLLADSLRSSAQNLPVVSVCSFLGLLALRLLAATLVPRVLAVFLRPGRVHVLYGFHYLIVKLVHNISNSRTLNVIFGDSSAIVHYLRLIGYNLNRIVQTGSNFGVEQKHDVPFLCSIGSGTMVADGLSMINVRMSNSSFALGQTSVGSSNYLGNNIYYPPDGKTGENCLLATKVMIPIEGPVRRDVGLLGSPCFEIPRMVQRDRRFRVLENESARLEQLRRKNRHNVVTVIGFLVVQWFHVHLGLVLARTAASSMGVPDVFLWTAFALAYALITVPYFAFLERATLGFRRMVPRTVSIYDEEFWKVERYWKASESVISHLFRGTPLKNIVSRLQGISVGAKVFDDGCVVTEKTLVKIGDYCNLNETCELQSHSLEEGVFKSDRIVLGRGCSVGCNALVHYGVEMGDGSIVEPNAFVMKGESVPPKAVWAGNPARPVQSARGVGEGGVVSTPEKTGALVEAHSESQGRL